MCQRPGCDPLKSPSVRMMVGSLDLTKRTLGEIEYLSLSHSVVLEVEQMLKLKHDTNSILQIKMLSSQHSKTKYNSWSYETLL